MWYFHDFEGLTSEQREWIAAQPIARMRRLADQLNWGGLQLYRVILSEEEAVRSKVLPPYMIAYYDTCDEGFDLQINEARDLGPDIYRATVKAERYGIIHLPWCEFTLYDDEPRFLSEVERLRPIIDRRNFKNPKWRRRFAQEHPELTIAHYRCK